MKETTATLIQTIAENQPRIKEEGKAVGRKEEHDAFWDEVFKTAGSFIGRFAGEGWTAENFRPTKDIRIVDKNANYCFYNNGCEVDLVERCEELGINIVIKPTMANNMFCLSKFTRLPELDFSAITTPSLQSVLDSCSKLVTVDKLILKDDGSQTFPSTLNSCSALENIVIEGTIGQNLNIRWSTKLTKASLMSFMEHLSTTNSFTFTMPIVAVNKAFETAEGANDGSTSAEWLALVNARKNVTISLVN